MPGHLPCPETDGRGTPCQKDLYRARDGQDWPHAGGHVFATDETWTRLSTGAYDAGAALAGLPFEVTTPDGTVVPGNRMVVPEGPEGA